MQYMSIWRGSSNLILIPKLNKLKQILDLFGPDYGTASSNLNEKLKITAKAEQVNRDFRHDQFGLGNCF